MTFPAIDRALDPYSPLGQVGRAGNVRRRVDARLAFGSRDTPSGFAGLPADPNMGNYFRTDEDSRDSLDSTMRAIDRALQQPNLSESERKELSRLRHQTVKDAVFPKGRGGALGMLGTALEFISRPGQLVVTGLMDAFVDRSSVKSLLGFDTSDAPEIGVSDYAAVATGNRERTQGFLGGPEGMVNFSDLLSHAGWKPDGGTLNRLGRFFVSLGGDVVTDPVSYVTLGGGGVGAVVRRTSAENAIQYTAQDVLARELTEAGLEATTRSALARHAGRVTSLADEPYGPVFRERMLGSVDDVLEETADQLRRSGLADDVIEEALESMPRRQLLEAAAEKTIRDEMERIVVPVVTRDFAKVDPAFAKLKNVVMEGDRGFLGTGLFKKHIIGGYVTGGIRLGGAFGGPSVTIKGTVGAGREITEAFIKPLWEGLKHFGPLQALSERYTARLLKMASAGGRVARRASRELLEKRLVADLGIEGLDLIHMREFRESALGGLVAQNRELNGVAAVVNREIARSGDDPALVQRQIGDLMESGGESLPVAELVTVGREIGSDRAVLEAGRQQAIVMRRIADDLHGQLGKYVPELGDLGATYVPHTPSTSGRKVITMLANDESVTVRAADNDLPMGLLEMLVNSHRVKTAAGAVGASSHMAQREFAEGAVNIIPSSVGDSAILRSFIEGGHATGMVQLKFSTVAQLNTDLKDALARVAADHPNLGLDRLLKDADFTFFEDNAMLSFGQYIASMQQSLFTYEMADAAERFGVLARRTLGEGLEEDIAATATQVLRKWWYAADQKGITPADSFVNMLVRNERLAFEPDTVIRVGDTEITVPSVVASHKDYANTVRAIDRELKRTRTEARRFARQADIRKRELIRQGWDPDTAEAMSRGSIQELLDEAHRLQEIADEVAEDMQGALSETLARQRHVVTAEMDDAAVIARQKIDEIRAIARKAKADLRREAETIIARHREPTGPIVTRLTDADLGRLEVALRSHADQVTASTVTRLRAESDDLLQRARMTNQPLVDADGGQTALGREVSRLRNEADILEAAADPDFKVAYAVYQREAAEAEARHAKQAARHVLADLEEEGRIPKGGWANSEEIQTAFDEVEAFDSDFFGIASLREAAEGSEVIERRILDYKEAASWEVRRIRTRLFEGATWSDTEWARYARPQANPFAAIRRGDIDAAGRWIADTDPAAWDQITEMLHDIGLSQNISLRSYLDAKTGKASLAFVDEAFLEENAQRLPRLTELVKAAESSEIAEDALIRAALAHPDTRGLVDNYRALQDAQRTYESAYRMAVRKDQKATRQLEQLNGAIERIGKALDVALHGTTASPRRALRAALYDVKPNGRWVLNEDGKVLRELLPEEEFMRLHNNAEYLAVLGDLGRPTPTAVYGAVRASKDFQDRMARMWNPETARTHLQDMADGLTAEMAENATETVTDLQELVDLINGFRRLFPDVDDPTGRAFVGPVFGREAEGQVFIEQVGRARELIDALRKRKVISSKQANRAREALEPRLAAADIKKEGGGRFVDFSTVGLNSGALEGASGKTQSVVDYFASFVDVTKNIFDPGGLRALKESQDKMLGWWKTATTVRRVVPFNTRNLQGAGWNNMIFALPFGDPIYFRTFRAGTTFRTRLRRAGGEIEEVFDRLPDEMSDIMRAAADQPGVLESFASNDLYQTLHGLQPVLSREGAKQAMNPFGPGFITARAGARMMESIEDYMRLALFAKHYNPLYPESARTAGAFVRAAHFDYSDLSTLERRIKRYIPFYVWAKRNLGLQMRMMVERPEVILRYYKLQRNLSDNFGGEGEPYYDSYGVSDWWGPYAAATDTFLRKDTPYWARIFIDTDMPVQDLLDFPLFTDGMSPSAMFQWFGNLVGPQLDIITPFTNPDDDYTRGAPFPLAYAWRFGEALGIFPDRTLEGGETRLHPKAVEWFDTIFPEVRQLLEPLTVPQDPARAQRMGFAPGDTGLGARFRALGLEQARGLGIQLQTPRDQASASFQLREEIDRILEDLKFRGEFVDQSSQGSVDNILSRAFGSRG